MPDFKDNMRRLRNELRISKEQGSKLGRGITADQSRQLEQAISLTDQAIRGELSQTEWQKTIGPLMLSLGKADVAFDQRNQQAVIQINIGNLNITQPITPERITPERRAEYEAVFLQRIRERFEKDAPYYIELSGETTESAMVQDDSQAPRSVRRRRQRMSAEYREWIQEGCEIVRRKLNTLRQAVDKYPCVILLGDPGCGKTTALQHLAYELAGEAGQLPVPLLLSEFAADMSMEDFIVNGWGGPENAGHWNAAELTDNLVDYLEDGKLFCLFDALNEMPHEGFAHRARVLRSFINNWSSRGNRFMVTCRVLDYGEELSDLQRVEIQPLGDDQIENFLQKELPQIWQKLWGELTKDGDSQRSLLELARNPYMLTVMIDVFTEDGQLGRNRSELMTRFTEILMKWAEKKCPPERWLDHEVQREALVMMAFEIQIRSGFGTMVKTAQAKAVLPAQVQPDPKWPPEPSPADQILNLAATAHIIEMSGDRSSLRFYHQLLQEYYAAREMLKRDTSSLAKLWHWPWLEKDMPKWVRPKGNFDPLPPPPLTNWEETTIMAAGLAPQNDDQLVRSLLGVNPVLAGRCLHEGQAKVNTTIRQEVVDQLLSTIFDPDVALRVRIAASEVLGHLGDPRLGKLVVIPAGTFLMGDDQEDDVEPQNEIVLPEYQIGKFPVTNAEFREFVDAGGYDEMRWWAKTGWANKNKENWTEPRYWAEARFNKPNQPVVGVSWYECLAYSRWRSADSAQHYRLPTEAEWEKAARGTDGRYYPWGNYFEPERLNSAEGDQTVTSTTPVGIYSRGGSPYGCLDMAGNVWEWTGSLWGKGQNEADYNCLNESGDGRENLEASDDILRVLRGGSFFDNQYEARCAFRFRLNPDLGYPIIGFRVVVSPISSSSAL